MSPVKNTENKFLNVPQKIESINRNENRNNLETVIGTISNELGCISGNKLSTNNNT